MDGDGRDGQVEGLAHTRVCTGARWRGGRTLAKGSRGGGVLAMGLDVW